MGVTAGWLAALRPRGPYPVLALHGEQGSSKSTTARALRNLVDPNAAGLRSEPREPRDLAIAANNAWVLAVDNLSRISSWLSDALCRLSTGGGFSTRTLYENDEESIFNAQRPCILNGITELATRSDLLDRCLVVELPRIPEKKRRPESEYWASFEQAVPHILGAVLNGVSAAIRNLPNTSIDRLPRMADFALWASAAETALGLESGQFMALYQDNRREAHGVALESCPIVPYLRTLATENECWVSTAASLLDELNGRALENDKRAKGWPSTRNVRSGTLRRIAPDLRAAGIDINWYREGTPRIKKISIRKVT